MSDAIRFEDQVVIVTGAGGGLGRAHALLFARHGARVVVNDLGGSTHGEGANASAADKVVEEIRAFGGTAVANHDSVTDGDKIVQTALDTFGRIDVLVNVAGGSGPIGKTGWETTQSEFDEIVQLNMTGCFNTMRAVMPAMIEQGSGKIVNVGGTFGMRGRAGRMAYSASKWGLRGITKSFALEAGPHGINVNCVAPGMVDGPRFRDKVCANMAAQLDISPEEAATRHAADYALKRVSTDQDVANACLFLGSDVSRQITGVDLPVDGGWAML